MQSRLIRWVAGLIAEQGLEPIWVSPYAEPIVKASLNFCIKFLGSIVLSWIRLTLTNNILTLDHAVLIASILASYEVDWASLIVE